MHTLLIHCVRLAGMFKESQLWKVHAEGPAGGSYAAGAQVSPPPAGTVLQTLVQCCGRSVAGILQSDINKRTKSHKSTFKFRRYYVRVLTRGSVSQNRPLCVNKKSSAISLTLSFLSNIFNDCYST